MPTQRLSQEKENRIRLLLKRNKTYEYIAKDVDVSVGTVHNVANSDQLHKDTIEQELKNTIKVQNVKYKEALNGVKRLEQELSIYCALDNYARYFEPITIKRKPNGCGEAVAFLNLGDWHIDEIVDEDAVNGLNKFDPVVAEQRIMKVWDVTLSLLEICRTKDKIDTIVVTILGDLISGWIHEALMATNEMTPPEAVLKLFNILTSGLEFLSKESGAKEIIVVPVCGNHGRITHKKYDKIAVKTNYEWLVYQLLARWFTARNNKIIRFKLPQGYFNTIIVYDQLIRISHGDNIQYQGGVGGVNIPIRKAIDRWNTAQRASYNILGHWHSYQIGEDYLINGSIIGYSEYSIRIKATYQRPMQSFFIMHPKYGPTAQFPIILGV